MQRLAACEQIPQRRRGRPGLVQQGFSDYGRNKCHSDVFFQQPITQQIGRSARLFLDQDQSCPCRQVRPDFPDRGVKTDSGKMARPIVGRDPKRASMPEDAGSGGLP